MRGSFVIVLFVFWFGCQGTAPPSKRTTGEKDNGTQTVSGSGKTSSDVGLVITASGGGRLDIPAGSFSKDIDVAILSYKKTEVVEIMAKKGLRFDYDPLVEVVASSEVVLGKPGDTIDLLKPLVFALPASALPASALPASALPASARPAMFLAGNRWKHQETSEIQIVGVTTFFRPEGEIIGSPVRAMLSIGSGDHIDITINPSQLGTRRLPGGTKVVTVVFTIKDGGTLKINGHAFSDLPEQIGGTIAPQDPSDAGSSSLVDLDQIFDKSNDSSTLPLIIVADPEENDSSSSEPPPLDLPGAVTTDDPIKAEPTEENPPLVALPTIDYPNPCPDKDFGYGLGALSIGDVRSAEVYFKRASEKTNACKEAFFGVALSAFLLLPERDFIDDVLKNLGSKLSLNVGETFFAAEGILGEMNDHFASFINNLRMEEKVSRDLSDSLVLFEEAQPGEYEFQIVDRSDALRIEGLLVFDQGHTTLIDYQLHAYKEDFDPPTPPPTDQPYLEATTFYENIPADGCYGDAELDDATYRYRVPGYLFEKRNGQDRCYNEQEGFVPVVIDEPGFGFAPPAINDLIVFDKDDIILIDDDTIYHFDGLGWTILASEVDLDFHVRMNRVWGTSSTSFFVAGDSGFLGKYEDGDFFPIDLIDDDFYVDSFSWLGGSSDLGVYLAQKSGRIFHYDGDAFVFVADIDQDILTVRLSESGVLAVLTPTRVVLVDGGDIAAIPETERSISPDYQRIRSIAWIGDTLYFAEWNRLYARSPEGSTRLLDDRYSILNLHSFAGDQRLYFESDGGNLLDRTWVDAYDISSGQSEAIIQTSFALDDGKVYPAKVEPEQFLLLYRSDSVLRIEARPGDFLYPVTNLKTDLCPLCGCTVIRASCLADRFGSEIHFSIPDREDIYLGPDGMSLGEERVIGPSETLDRNFRKYFVLGGRRFALSDENKGETEGDALRLSEIVDGDHFLIEIPAQIESSQGMTYFSDIRKFYLSPDRLLLVDPYFHVIEFDGSGFSAYPQSTNSTWFDDDELKALDNGRFVGTKKGCSGENLFYYFDGAKIRNISPDGSSALWLFLERNRRERGCDYFPPVYLKNDRIAVGDPLGMHFVFDGIRWQAEAEPGFSAVFLPGATGDSTDRIILSFDGVEIDGTHLYGTLEDELTETMVDSQRYRDRLPFADLEDFEHFLDQIRTGYRAQDILAKIPELIDLFANIATNLRLSSEMSAGFRIPPGLLFTNKELFFGPHDALLLSGLTDLAIGLLKIADSYSIEFTLSGLVERATDGSLVMIAKPAIVARLNEGFLLLKDRNRFLEARTDFARGLATWLEVLNYLKINGEIEADIFDSVEAYDPGIVELIGFVQTLSDSLFGPTRMPHSFPPLTLDFSPVFAAPPDGSVVDQLPFRVDESGDIVSVDAFFESFLEPVKKAIKKGGDHVEMFTRSTFGYGREGGFLYQPDLVFRLFREMRSRYILGYHLGLYPGYSAEAHRYDRYLRTLQ